MAQFALPAGFSTSPPSAGAPASVAPFTLPPGFSTSPPPAQQAAPPPQAPNPFMSALENNPITGPITRGAEGLAQGVNAMASAGPVGPDERRGMLLPIIHNARTGENRFAAPQIALDAANAFTLPGDVASGRTPFDPRVPFSQQDPATLDRAANLAAMAGAGTPMAQSGMTAGAGRLMTAEGQRIPGLVASDLTRSNIAPQDVNAQIAALGPGAVLADISPVLQGRAAKLATLPEQAQTIVSDTLSARQANAGPRIQRALNDIAGPEPVPSTVTAGIEARKQIIGPYYERLFQNTNRPVNTQPIVSNLNGNVAMTRGPAQKALAQVRQMFNLPGPIAGPTGQAVTTDPRTVFEIRNAIDGMLATETNPKVIGALTNVRQRIDNALAAAVPGLKNVDAYFQEQARQQEGFDLGRTALRHGESPVHPDDLAAAMQQTAMQSSVGPMGHPSQFPTMIRNGMLSKIYEIVGNNTNDRISLRKILTGDGKWNYQKIAAAFGEDKARQLLNLFQNEATMANTENLALAGSKTARMASGGQGMEANPNAAGVLKSALNLDFGDAALGLGSKLTGGAFNARRAARNATIADALMSSGFRALPPPMPLPPVVVPYTKEIGQRSKEDLLRLLGLN